VSPDDAPPVRISHRSGVLGFRVLGDGILVGPGYVSASPALFGDLPISTRLTITHPALSAPVNASLVALRPWALIVLDTPLLGFGFANAKFPDLGASWLRAALDDFDAESPDRGGTVNLGTTAEFDSAGGTAGLETAADAGGIAESGTGDILAYVRQLAADGRIDHGVAVPPIVGIPSPAAPGGPGAESFAVAARTGSTAEGLR
jgi:hypothetical protein